MLASHRTVLRVSLALVLVGALPPRTASPQLAAPEPAAKIASAWRALEEHRYGLAAGLFETAARTSPNDASLWFGAGVSALMRGLNGPAETWFENALAIDPTLTDASILLGQALYRDGRVTDAVHAYERALIHAPDNPELVEPLARWRVQLATDVLFHELRGTHFDIRHLPADDGLARRVLDVLESAHARLASELSASTHRTIQVVLYSPDQFRTVTELPPWAVGIYDGRIKVPLGGTSPSAEQLHRVLEHELVHAIVATIAGPTVPAWMNEGLATALEPNGTAWATDVRAESATPPRADLLPRAFRNLVPAQARAAYAASTRVVQRLLDDYGIVAVVRLLRSVGLGIPFQEAFYDTVGSTVEDFAAATP